MAVKDTKALYQQLLETIEAEMEYCSAENTPFICANLSKGGESKDMIIKLIAEYVMKNRTIGQAILDCERDHNPNMADNPYN